MSRLGRFSFPSPSVPSWGFPLSQCSLCLRHGRMPFAQLLFLVLILHSFTLSRQLRSPPRIYWWEISVPSGLRTTCEHNLSFLAPPHWRWYWWFLDPWRSWIHWRALFLPGPTSRQRPRWLDHFLQGLYQFHPWKWLHHFWSIGFYPGEHHQQVRRVSRLRDSVGHRKLSAWCSVSFQLCRWFLRLWTHERCEYQITNLQCTYSNRLLGLVQS